MLHTCDSGFVPGNRSNLCLSRYQLDGDEMPILKFEYWLAKNREILVDHDDGKSEISCLNSKYCIREGTTMNESSIIAS